MSSITHRPGDSSPWQVRWREDGRERSKRLKHRKAAQQFLADLNRRLDLGDDAPELASDITVAEWLARWIATDGVAWARTTHAQRLQILKKWCEPYIGDLRIRNLNVKRIKGWRGEMLGDGASAGVANACIRDLSAALTAAASEGLIDTNPLRANPLRRVPQPLSARRPADVSDIEKIRSLLDPRDQLMVDLMAYAGLRPAEVLGLRWGDFVIDGNDAVGSVVVARSVQLGRIAPTKTGRIRVVPLVGPAIEDLCAYVAVLDPDAGPSARIPDAMVTLAAGTELVFPNGGGAPIDWRNWCARVWRPAVAAAGVPHIVPYELRHTFASLRIAEGRTVLEVAAWLGHSTPTLTLSTYGHLFARSQMSSGESMESAVRRARAHAAASG